jgi:integrase
MTGCESFNVQVLKNELWYRAFVPLLNRALDVAFYSFGILGALIDLAVCSESRYAADAKPAEPSRQKVDLVAMARRRYQRPRVNSLGEGTTKRWTVRYRQDEVNGSGKRVRVCKQTTLGLCSELTRAQAQRAADELLGKRANSLQPSTTITFETFVETKYRPNALPMRKPAGQRIAKTHLTKHLLPWLGEIPLNAVNLEAVQRMASALIQGRNGKPGITPNTVWNICGTLLSVFKFAKLWGYPVCEFKRKGLAMPYYNPPEVKPFTVEEALRIFEASGPFYGVLFTTQAALALRPGEAIGLFVDDFDFERGTVLIQRNADIKELVTTKGGNVEYLRLSPPLANLLREYLAREWKHNRLGLLFPHPKTGELLQQKAVREDILYPILEALKIERRGLHSFRHLAASVLVDVGTNQKALGRALRHQDGGVLALKKYAHILGNAEITMMDKLGESLVRPSRKPVISELRTDAQSKNRSAYSA